MIKELPEQQLLKIGSKLSQLRIKTNLTVAQVAKKCGLTSQQIENMEQGVSDYPFPEFTRLIGFYDYDLHTFFKDGF